MQMQNYFLCNIMGLQEKKSGMAVKEKENNLGMLPQNIEAEEAVLGAILVNPNVITKVVEILKPESFYKPAHRYIYDAMLQFKT